MKPVAIAVAKTGRSALRRLLSSELSSDKWALAGRFDAVETSPGLYIARIPSDDPLRLEHVSGRKLVVPWSELETDFASVPNFVQKMTGHSDLLHLQATSYKAAALLHDFLYASAWCWAVWKGRAVRVPVSKKQADAVLFIALCCSGATLADGLAYHGAVSLFGGRAWRACRCNPIDGEPLFGTETKPT